MRVLLLAEQANPNYVSVPLVGWQQVLHISREVDVLVATDPKNREAFVAAGFVEGETFAVIDTSRISGPIYKAIHLLLGKSERAWTVRTALGIPVYYFFEHLVWRAFGDRIRKGEFDVVHRITPLSPVIPSTMARKCARAGVPFVLGPINGGVPWPKGFGRVRFREMELLTYFREAYKLLPGCRATRKHAAAIIAGSQDTRKQLPDWCRERVIYIPENGIDPARFGKPGDRIPETPLRVAFVGRLVPYKGVDMLIDACAPLIREGKIVLSIIGNGPERERLAAQVERLALGDEVNLVGWVPNETLQDHLREYDVFGFPSIREFGGGVVLEAMALGLVPVVIDYAGPRELVSDDTGYRVPLGTRDEIVDRLRDVFASLAESPGHLPAMGLRARARVAQLFTWEAKARQTVEIYKWVCGEVDKPRFGFSDEE